MLPRADLAQLFALSPWHWSVHSLTGSVAGQAALFCAAGVLALALTVGYRTRLATAGSWFLLVSLQNRNPMVLYGADQLLRMLLFWSIFLPLGACWSVDRARRAGSASGPMRHLSAASAAILLQVSAMYLFSGLLKRNEAWWSGEALSHVLSFEMYARPSAEAVLQHGELLRLVTPAVPWLEMVLALALFLPWGTARFRAVALVLLAGFHLTIESLLMTGLFQYVALTGLILFLPTRLWDRFSGVTAREHAARAEPRRSGQRLVNGAVQALVLALFAYVVAWNVAGLGLEEYWASQRSSWAQEQLGRGEGRGLPILPRDAIVERRLGSFGALGRVASLHQRWDMFYRTGRFEGGWNAFVGTLPDGRRISLLEGGKALEGETRPEPPRTLNARGSVYLTYLRTPGMQALRDRLAAVVGRDWNRRHPELAIDRLEILFVQGAGPDRRTTRWFEGKLAPDFPERRPHDGELGEPATAAAAPRPSRRSLTPSHTT